MPIAVTPRECALVRAGDYDKRLHEIREQCQNHRKAFQLRQAPAFAEPGLGSQRIHGHTEGHSREREVFGIVLVTAGGYDKRLADNSGQHKDLVDLKDANLVQNLGLAVRGFRAMLTDHAETPGVSKSVVVIAGGYDKRLAENREHYGELGDLIAEYSLQDKVSTFMCPECPSALHFELEVAKAGQAKYAAVKASRA